MGTPINSAMSRANLAQTLAAIAEPRRRRLAATPEPPVSIRRLEEEPSPTPSPPEKSLETEHRRTPSPLPFKTARAASPSPAFRGPFSPQ
jgi:hypothetical protein